MLWGRDPGVANHSSGPSPSPKAGDKHSIEGHVAANRPVEEEVRKMKKRKTQHLGIGGLEAEASYWKTRMEDWDETEHSDKGGSHGMNTRSMKREQEGDHPT
eukprot:NODE_953_length_646_cov_81.117253_g882_i0.p2 GENE.NODE_953_length_646_cov_81.117253_g882_i0~~NODE_953_length_646_cov_81.117253_g882_i0.p2  ORF type:complete len:102 (+),score=19.21 NODE_953_length_646_cov_81.117253_g882_i0:71-376(+)